MPARFFLLCGMMEAQAIGELSTATHGFSETCPVASITSAEKVCGTLESCFRPSLLLEASRHLSQYRTQPDSGKGLLS